MFAGSAPKVVRMAQIVERFDEMDVRAAARRPDHHQGSCAHRLLTLRMLNQAPFVYSSRFPGRGGPLTAVVAMTYCVGMLLDAGLVFLSDSRTNAGVDQISTFRKVTVFERPGERVMVLLTAGNLAISQAVVNVLNEHAQNAATPSIWGAKNMFE